MITSRLMLSTMLLGWLALPALALAQTHAVAPHLNGLHHHHVRPVHRIAVSTNAGPDVRAPVVAASPVSGPVAGTSMVGPSTMPHRSSGTTPMPAPRVGATVPATSGVKAN